MFITIMCSVWLGVAGPIIVGGLYTRVGITAGAWCALVCQDDRAIGRMAAADFLNRGVTRFGVYSPARYNGDNELRRAWR
jgi:hypothetical protein